MHRSTPTRVLQGSLGVEGPTAHCQHNGANIQGRRFHVKQQGGRPLRAEHAHTPTAAGTTPKTRSGADRKRQSRWDGPRIRSALSRNVVQSTVANPESTDEASASCGSVKSSRRFHVKHRDLRPRYAIRAHPLGIGRGRRRCTSARTAQRQRARWQSACPGRGGGLERTHRSVYATPSRAWIAMKSHGPTSRHWHPAAVWSN